MFLSQSGRFHHLVDVLVDRRLVGSEVLPSNNVAEADGNPWIGSLYRRNTGANLFEADWFARLVHCLEGGIRSRIERESQPVAFLEDFGHIKNAVQSAAVSDDPNGKSEPFNVSDGLRESWIGRGFSSSNEDNGSQPARCKIRYRVEKMVVFES